MAREAARSLKGGLVGSKSCVGDAQVAGSAVGGEDGARVGCEVLAKKKQEGGFTPDLFHASFNNCSKPP